MNTAELVRVRQLPLHQSWGIRDIQSKEGQSEVLVEVTENMLNPTDMLHGGLIYALCDLAAYTALLSQIDENQIGVTHQINVQVIKPVNLGDKMIVKGRLIRLGRSLSFLESKAFVNDKLVASATITKSMVLVQELSDVSIHT